MSIPHLGQSGLQNAQDLLNDGDRVVDPNDAIFGTTGGPVSVIVFASGRSYRRHRRRRSYGLRLHHGRRH